LGCKHDGLETACADFVDGGSIGRDGHTGTDGNLSCRRLANASLHNVAKEDLFNDLGVNLGLFEGALEGNNT